MADVLRKRSCPRPTAIRMYSLRTSRRIGRVRYGGLKTGRTSKRIRGARGWSILTSVLESLRLSLPEFKLAHVLEEVTAWQTTVRGCFRQLLRSQNQPPPESSRGRVNSPLNAVLPATSH